MSRGNGGHCCWVGNRPRRSALTDRTYVAVRAYHSNVGSSGEPHEGIAAGERLSGAPYFDARPAGHSRVCWAAAIGRASRGRSHATDHAEIIVIATRDLAEHPELCTCARGAGTRG